jgi:hypothetical protein
MATTHVIVTVCVKLNDHERNMEKAMKVLDQEANEVIREHGGNLCFAPVDTVTYSSGHSNPEIYCIIRTLVVLVHII